MNAPDTGSTMRYKAVVFDLFGTLVDSSSYRSVRDMLIRMAEAAGLPPEGFLRLWMGETRLPRSRGDFPTIRACVAHIAEKLSCRVTPSQLQEAEKVRLAFSREALRPRPDAVPTLRHLKDAGLHLGLISDCSPDVPFLWNETELAPLLDVAIFSCSVGLTKPHPAIYHRACNDLGVAPHQCLYVGDGDSEELTGAECVGMQAVMIRVPYDEGHRIREDNWRGRKITALKEIVPLLSGPPRPTSQEPQAPEAR